MTSMTQIVDSRAIHCLTWQQAELCQIPQFICIMPPPFGRMGDDHVDGHI